jgi:hypothetical protein
VQARPVNSLHSFSVFISFYRCSSVFRFLLFPEPLTLPQTQPMPPRCVAMAASVVPGESWG